MKLLSSLHETFGFTRNELKVILILSTTLAIGLGVRWYGRTFPPPQREAAQEFDYARQDSLFLARSRMLDPIGRDLPLDDSAREGTTTDRILPAVIDINSASKEELLLLPGIGEKYAGRIILHRKEHGPFRTVEQLLAVRGIGPKTLERIRPFIAAGERAERPTQDP